MARSVEIAEVWDAALPVRTEWVWASPPAEVTVWPQRPYRADAEWAGVEGPHVEG